MFQGVLRDWRRTTSYRIVPTCPVEIMCLLQHDRHLRSAFHRSRHVLDLSQMKLKSVTVRPGWERSLEHCTYGKCATFVRITQGCIHQTSDFPDSFSSFAKKHSLSKLRLDLGVTSVQNAVPDPTRNSFERASHALRFATSTHSSQTG